MSTSERGQKAKKVVVPSLEEDSAERKRLLNVLAQRRYRRRKREHLQRLEKLNDQEFSLLPESEVDTSPSSNAAGGLPVSHDLAATLADHNVGVTFADTDFPMDALVLSQVCDDPFNFEPSSLDAFETSLSFPQPPLSTSPSATITTSTSSNTANSSPTSGLDFPDETYLPMAELNLLRGAMSIAERLGVDSIIWSLEANSLFHNSTASMHNHLPLNLRPTRAQLTNPHHPALDILPWPSVRDRLILMFAQPENLRPPSARSPTALVEFVYDLEDPFEGARIWGTDPYSDESWEVGEKLFQNWWWALDRRVLHRSNQLRLARGAPLLGANNRIREIE